MPWEDNEWGARVRLSDSPLPDIEPHVARATDGTIFVVWQALEGRYSHIRLSYLKGGKWSKPVAVTSSQLNDWEPAVAAGSDGKAWVVWRPLHDQLRCLRALLRAGRARMSAEMAIATTPRFEAHSSIAVDARNRPWVAFEKWEG